MVTAAANAKIAFLICEAFPVSRDSTLSANDSFPPSPPAKWFRRKLRNLAAVALGRAHWSFDNDDFNVIVEAGFVVPEAAIDKAEEVAIEAVLNTFDQTILTVAVPYNSVGNLQLVSPKLVSAALDEATA